MEHEQKTPGGRIWQYLSIETRASSDDTGQSITFEGTKEQKKGLLQEEETLGTTGVQVAT